MELCVNDYVLVKDGAIREDGKPTCGWGGQIIRINEKTGLCLLEFDAQTINSLDDDFLISVINALSSTTDYFFHSDDLIKSERRDTDAELDEAYLNLKNRIEELDKKGLISFDEDEEEYDDDDDEEELIYTEEVLGSYYDEFCESPFYGKLNNTQKTYSYSIIFNFLHHSLNILEVEPEDWNKPLIREACLDMAPRYLIADTGFFESFSDVLFQYIAFLHHEGILLPDQAKSLQAELMKIRNQIPLVESNHANWSSEKLIYITAREFGYDLNNEEEMNDFAKFMLDVDKNLNVKDIFSTNTEQFQLKQNIKKQQKASDKPAVSFKGIARNQYVTVKYKNGDVKERVKFKRVEQDLLNGVCELVTVH